MKSFVLLLSFITFAATGEGTSVTVDSVLRSIRSLGSIRSRNVRAAGDIHSDYEELKIKAECDIFGTNDSYNKTVAPLAEAKLCTERVASTLTPNTDAKQVIKQLCSKSEDLKRCMTPYAEVLSDCAAPGERASVKKFMSSMYDFLCAEDRILPFVLGGAGTCFTDKAEAMEQCVTTVYPADKKVAVDGMTASQLQQSVCKSRAYIQQCVRDQLGQCDSPAALNFFNDLVKAEGSAWKCYDLEASRA